MKVKDLIEQLQKMPQDAEVYHLWDGEPRTRVNVVYVSKSGHVITADFSQDSDSTESRPINAPSVKEQQYRQTPEDPNRDRFWDFLD
jgi:hypothetical protein